MKQTYGGNPNEKVTQIQCQCKKEGGVDKMGCCFAKMKVMFKMSVLLFKLHIVVVLLVMGN